MLDPRSSAPESWTTGEAHAYQVQVTVRNEQGGQGKTASTAFTWEAEST